jgi:hypothetical protein
MRNKTKDDKKLHNSPVALPSVADKEVSVACQFNTELISVPQTGTDIWQNPRVAKLISQLLSRKITRLNPEIDFNLKDSFSYREADDILGTSGRATSLVLESLAKEGLLCKEDFEKILLSPDGSIQLIPVERCPKCDSAQLTRGKMIEHFSCGHVGLEAEFLKGLKHVCPKCSKELKLIGTDYRNPGLLYTCNNCHDIFPLPTIKYRCLKTGNTYDTAELRHLWLYSYRLNEANRNRLEFELEPKKQLIDYLHGLGYDVQESVQLQGRSGAAHTIDLLASMNDRLVKHMVAIGILAAPQGKEEVTIDSLFSFDSKLYDIGIEHKIVLAFPKLGLEAARFADRQGIRVYGREELRALLSKRPESPEITVDERELETAESGNMPDLAKPGCKNWLISLFEKKGYFVDENVRIKGKSGNEHILGFYAHKDDGIISHQLAACIIVNGHTGDNDVDNIIDFDTATYDAGIRDKVIISLPELCKEARQFAECRHIRVLEVKDLADFSSHLMPELQLAV